MGKTVLVVEDDKGVQKMLADALEGEGFAVICEKDGNWALRTFENKQVDFIILDILIPVMNGFQLAERIRKHPKGATVPIIMISGVYRAMSHRLEAIKKYNVVEYLDKPVKLDQLFALMRQTIGADYPRPEPAPPPPPEPGGYTDSQSIAEREEVESQEGGESIEDLKGSLSDRPFPEILALLYQKHATGALLMKSAKVKKIVYFQDGRPTFVKSNLLNECLGRIMVSEKMITPEDLDESVQRMKSSKRQQGTILIEMGCISPHNLVYALEKQLEVKLYDIFSWPNGEFQFNPKASVETPITTLDLSPASIIYEGIRRRYDPARVENDLLRDMNSYLTPNPDAKMRFQDMTMDDEEAALLQSFDEPQVLRDVIAGAVMPRDKLMRFVYALRATGIVLLTATPGGVELPPPIPAQPPPLPPPIRRSQVPMAAPGVPVEEKEIIDRLLKKAADLKQKNYFELLGISRTASAGDVKRAYFALAKEYHPDRLPVTVSREVRKVAEELFQLITTAQDVLSDAKRRDAYVKELSTGVKAGMSDEVTRILAAEGQFQQGETYLRKRMFAKAAECFKEAIDLYADEAEFHCHYGWALFQSDPENRDVQKTAREAISSAISLNPKIDKSYLFLGYIYKATGRQDLAEQQFEKAIQCNPDCTDALRELRLLDMRRGQRPGQPAPRR